MACGQYALRRAAIALAIRGAFFVRLCLTAYARTKTFHGTSLHWARLLRHARRITTVMITHARRARRFAHEAMTHARRARRFAHKAMTHARHARRFAHEAMTHARSARLFAHEALTHARRARCIAESLHLELWR